MAMVRQASFDRMPTAWLRGPHRFWLEAAMARHQADGSAYLATSQRKGLRREAYNAEVLRINGDCGGLVVPQDIADAVDRALKERTAG